MAWSLRPDTLNASLPLPRTNHARSVASPTWSPCCGLLDLVLRRWLKSKRAYRPCLWVCHRCIECPTWRDFRHLVGSSRWIKPAPHWTAGQYWPERRVCIHIVLHCQCTCAAPSRGIFAVILRQDRERRIYEDALAKMGRKLIGAYEEEQTRIVRELYDNINQQIASFGCEVDRRNARWVFGPNW